MSTTEQAAANHAAYNAACADVLHGRVLRTDDVVAVDLGTGLAFLDAVVVVRPVGAASVVEVAAAFYDGRPHVVLDYIGTGDLEPFGYRALDPLPVMVRPPDGAAAPSRLDVEVVGDHSALGEFEQVYTEGLDLRADGDRRLWGPRVLGHPAVRLHLGRVDGSPVACAVTVVSDGCVGLYGVATLPEHRRRGHGSAVTAAALASAPTVPAVLTASPESIGVYRRLGFVEAGSRATWTYAFPTG